MGHYDSPKDVALAGQSTASVSQESNVKQQVSFAHAMADDLEAAVARLTDAMESAGIMTGPGPEAPMPSRKATEPNCPLSGALYELGRRLETRVHALRELRTRLAA